MRARCSTYGPKPTGRPRSRGTRSSARSCWPRGPSPTWRPLPAPDSRFSRSSTASRRAATTDTGWWWCGGRRRRQARACSSISAPSRSSTQTSSGRANVRPREATSMRSSARSMGAIVGLFLAVVVASSLGPSAPAHAVEIVQYFPVTPPDVPPAFPETGWRIRYEILPQLTHGYGGAAVWEIQSVEFMRGYTETGEQDWIKVLNNLALVEIYVPYYDGYEIWDVQGLSGFVPTSAAFVPGAGVLSATLQP